MKKRLLSLALALAICLSLTIPAAAASFTEIVSPDTLDSFCKTYGGTNISFHDGVTWRGEFGGAGYCAFDTNGNVIVGSGVYGVGGSSPQNFSDGVAWAKRDRNWCLVDTSGKELLVLSLDEGWLAEEKLVITADYQFHEGLSKIHSKETMKCGFIDKTGKLVIPCEHDLSRTGDFHEGLAKCYDSANAYYGYMDKTGKVVIPYQYANASDFVNGFAAVQIGNRWTFIDKTGKELLPQDYQYSDRSRWPDDISSQVVRVHTNNGGKWSFVNKSGQIVSDGYAGADAFVDGMARVGIGFTSPESYGYVNESGVLVIPCQYASAEAFRDGYAVVKADKRGGSYNIIDKTGKVTGTYSEYAQNVGNGCFRIGSSESGRTRVGLIDYTGREIVPCKYKEIKEFSGGVAAVKNFDDKWGFVDTTGAEIVPCKLTDVEYANEPGIFSVKNYNDDGRWSVIKSSGWTAPGAAPAAITADPTSSRVLVNGKEVSFDAYNIGGANYFRLRDLAYVLSGTEKQFEVGWDDASKTIALTSGKGYTAVGGEMTAGAPGKQSAAPSSAKLLVDGKEVSLTAYNIGGANYFKLRDIGQTFDFGIGWDDATRTITIDTSTGYTA